MESAPSEPRECKAGAVGGAVRHPWRQDITRAQTQPRQGQSADERGANREGQPGDSECQGAFFSQAMRCHSTECRGDVPEPKEERIQNRRGRTGMVTQEKP